MAFHALGLAPVKAETGRHHIPRDGSPLYARRYRMAYGYYCGLAAVLDDEGRFHIDVEGHPVYRERRPWIGNFQQDRCTVRDADGAYFHILPNGARLYTENFPYAGDYYDGQAWVRNAEGMYTHPDLEGRIVHGRYYRRLGVFHKGYATAGDETGMFQSTNAVCPLTQSDFCSSNRFTTAPLLPSLTTAAKSLSVKTEKRFGGCRKKSELVRCSPESKE
jgi:hypothetical protein